MNRLLGRTGIAGVGFTALLVSLIAVAAGPEVDAWFIVLQLAMVVGAVAFFLRAFPGSRFFAIAFANGLAVYSCLFLVFTETNFAQIGVVPMRIGFVLPLVAFLAGAMLRRDRIRRIVMADNVPDPAEVARSFLWLVPVFAVGIVTFILPTLHLSETAAGVAFLSAMAVIAAIVFSVSADVSRFLIETGLLFEEFFGRIAQMVVPTFAFLTFYSITVIVFAALYRIIDRLAEMPNFHVGGQARVITFPESLYFSIVTMATVGYGDIVPASDAARALAAIQVVLGVLLLLVGFSEIFSYTRERRRGRSGS